MTFFLTRRALASRIGIFVSLATILGAIPGLSAFGQQSEIYVGFFSSYGAGGYDVVAYHTENEARAGSNSFVAEWKNASWRFESAANRDLFTANPEKYAPQYGGYCAWAVANGYTARGNPANWTVYQGKLYLNYNRGIQQQWESDKAGFVEKSERNWPRVLGR